MSRLYQYSFGPRLYRIVQGHDNAKALSYTPNRFEKYGDSAITSLYAATSVVLYTSPLVLPFALRRGWLSLEGGIFTSQFIAGLCVVGLISLISRTIGRFSNPNYSTFLEVLSVAENEYSSRTKALLEKYDFHFSSWPVDFDVATVEKLRTKKDLSTARGFSLSVTDLLSRLLTNTFGLSLVYPGSMSLMGMLLEAPLLEGRTKLYLEHHGTRNKIKTRDNNYIDTMFVSQKSKENGGILVVCCEGNAGFYELGVMSTPIAGGYSTLGWNHPGFAGSTGSPYPEQERNAADAVMQFAIHKLNFKPQNIIVMGWSIGGYSATWLAINYPEINGLVLDATFDELEPLAIPRMPAFMAGIVKHTVNTHIKLNVAEQLCQFEGPVTIVRRLRDEMITTSMLDLSTNRGNELLVKMLSCRYPKLTSDDALSLLYSALDQPILTAQEDLRDTELVYTNFIKEKSAEFPSGLGEDLGDGDKFLMLLYLMVCIN